MKSVPKFITWLIDNSYLELSNCKEVKAPDDKEFTNEDGDFDIDAYIAYIEKDEEFRLYLINTLPHFSLSEKEYGDFYTTIRYTVLIDNKPVCVYDVQGSEIAMKRFNYGTWYNELYLYFCDCRKQWKVKRTALFSPLDE